MSALTPRVEKLRQSLAAAVQTEIARIVEGYHPERVYLFGSLVRGDVHVGSDIDLLIIKEDVEANFKDRISAVLDLCSGSSPVEVFIYTPAELDSMQRRGNDFVRTALAEGVLVYERQ